MCTRRPGIDPPCGTPDRHGWSCCGKPDDTPRCIPGLVGRAVVLSGDLEAVAGRLSARDFNRWLASPAGKSASYEERVAVWRRAFRPKWMVKVYLRLQERGIGILEGQADKMRATTQRHVGRFMWGLVSTIEAADKRARDAGS
jgi:hypothetical protein